MLVDERLADEVFELVSSRHAAVRMKSGVYPESYAVPNTIRYDPNASPDALLSGAGFAFSPWTSVATA